MATNTLNTRIILKNDTAANWSTSTLVLLSGEIAIESDTRKAKIGNGTDVFKDLSYINLTPEEVQTLIEAASHTHDNKDVLDATTASFTTALLNKLNGIANNANNYSLPTASSSTLGGVKIGTNVGISSGVISVANGSTSAKGVVQLTDSTSSTSTTTAATPNSVKSAYDLANTAKTNAATAQTAANKAQSTADSKIGSVALASGTNNGTLKLTVDGTATDNIAVKGLGSAAYTASSAYATAAQGTKADNAMPKAGGTFTGAVTLNADPTVALGAATKQYVDSAKTSATSSANSYTDTKIAGLINGAPETLDTLKEVADAIAANADVVSALDSAIGKKANASDLTSHTGNSTIHITSSERTKWNAAEVNQNAFSNVKVNSTTIAADSKTDTLNLVAGSNVTITPDADTDTITISSTNTDTKVTNTLNTTAKAYVTGTTSNSTNTGTQVFDTGVYLDTTAGMLTATTFKGALSGNASTATTATKANQLTTARSIGLGTAVTATAQSFNGTGNITIPITALNADYLVNGSSQLIFNCGNATA